MPIGRTLYRRGIRPLPVTIKRVTSAPGFTLKPLIATTNNRWGDARDNIASGGSFKARTEHQFGFDCTSLQVLLPTAMRLDDSATTGNFPEDTMSGSIGVLKVAIECNGTAVQITFGGSNTTTLQTTTLGYIQSDAVNASAFGLAKFSRDQFVYCRILATNSSGSSSTLPNGEPSGQFGASYSTYPSGTTPVDDVVATGGMSTTGGTAANLGYPMYIVATPTALGGLSVGHIDDSIGVGFSESWSTAPVQSGYGYFNRALIDANDANCIAGINFTRAASTLNNWLASHSYQDNLLKFVNVVGCKHGTNDFATSGTASTSSQMQTRITNLKSIVISLGAQRFIGFTLPPRTQTSTTAPVTGWDTGGQPDLYNQWVASSSGVYDQKVDLRTLLGDPAHNNFWWNTTYCSDSGGTHPNSTGHVAMAGNANMYRDALLQLTVDGIAPKPVLKSAPTISGLTPIGSTLTRTNGTYLNSTSISGYWARNGAAITPAQTGSTYVTVTADGGTAVTWVETATGAGGSITTPSNAVNVDSASATVFLNDTFTEASTVNLNAHTPNTGGAWSRNSNVSSTNTINVNGGTNRLVTTGVPAQYNNAATPPSANYDVEAVLKFDTLTASSNSRYIGARVSGTDQSGYFFGYRRGSTAFRLEVRSSTGTQTTLQDYTASSPVAQPTAGTSYTLKMSLRGSTITCYLNGTQVIQVTDSTITAAGLIALSAQNATSTATTFFDWTSIKGTSA